METLEPRRLLSAAATAVLAPNALPAVATLYTAGLPLPKLVSHWTLDQTGPTFADRGGSNIPLVTTTGTTQTVAGANGNAARLYEGPADSNIRLATANPKVQSDSFGFSFWFRPAGMTGYENLIGKEMAPTGGGEAFSRLAWQVQLGGDDGTGHAAVEFVVRGDQRAAGDYFGNVLSKVKVPLGTDSSQWIHVAGGYDRQTGKLTLYLNGSMTAYEGRVGARNSGGGAFVVGAIANGDTPVTKAARADIDDVQLYDSPLAASHVTVLLTDPGRPVTAAPQPKFSSTLTAHWKLDEAGPWYGDWSGNENNLNPDALTTAPARIAGVDHQGLGLNFDPNVGVTTRLTAAGQALQTDSFGFSFWIKPAHLNAFENFLAKEMAPTGGAHHTRMAWQVQVGADNGTGHAPIELVVRGADRSNGDFFGSVVSTATLPLGTDSNQWIHIAGGYDTTTGALSLHVNGDAFSAAGRAGANHSDGSWVSVGTVRNGLEIVAQGAGARIDDIQLYNGPLSTYDVAVLRKFPGRQINATTRLDQPAWSVAANGDLTVTFNSVDGWFYHIDASVIARSYTPVGIVAGVGGSTTVTFPKSAIDAVLGRQPRAKLFVQVRPVMADAVGTLNLPAAQNKPYPNGGRYVPQYHFSLPGAAVGDPNGVVRYDNQYHIFTWDHAESKDLVSWNNLGWPMREGLPDAGYWTGSAVVDVHNTSGFGTDGKPPMVAVYTIHNNITGKETIGISYSTNHRDFYTYAGNPVVSTDDVVFRDPDVFWDADRSRWLMLVSRPEARNIHFYASTDLKNWQFLSDFGPRGARNEIWEVPGLMQVPVQGAGNQKKWVLFTGAGTNKVQYYVGDFDGTRFIEDAATRDFLDAGIGIDGQAFADFETNGNYWDNGWTYVGDAFGDAPTDRHAGTPAQGILGGRLASSGSNGDYIVGSTLTSRSFTISKNAINFLIAGGAHAGKTCINLVIDGHIVRSTTGDNSDILKWRGWNVAEFIGREATLQIVDDYGGYWGRIYVDQITFADSVNDTGREHANWVDWGSDFFAPKAVRDYDGVETGARWLGWIGSWEYESQRPVPEGWGKGVESIFRDVQLIGTPAGYQLVQKPVESMQKLRGVGTTVLPRQIPAGTTTLSEFRPATNVYELEADFALTGSGRTFGLNLAVGGGNKIVIGYDTETGNVYLDRTRAGNVSFAPGFASVVSTPFGSNDGHIKFRIFMDQSSIEVFVNDGQRVLTSQVYSNPGDVGIELFSEGGSAHLQSLKAWTLGSIWADNYNAGFYAASNTGATPAPAAAGMMALRQTTTDAPPADSGAPSASQASALSPRGWLPRFDPGATVGVFQGVSLKDEQLDDVIYSVAARVL